MQFVITFIVFEVLLFVVTALYQQQNASTATAVTGLAGCYTAVSRLWMIMPDLLAAEVDQAHKQR